MLKPIISVELSINHEGKLENAFNMIEQAKQGGVDAVKLQNYKTEDFCQLDSTETYTYLYDGEMKTERVYDMFKRCEIDLQFVRICKQYAEQLGMLFHSTPTSADGVKDLLDMGCKTIKIASDMVKNKELIKAIPKDLQVIIATGHLNDLAKIQRFADRFENHIILHCVSQYPAKKSDLHKMQLIREQVTERVGYSDHCVGTQECIRAINLDAVWLEIHFCLDKTKAIDGAFSKDVNDLKEIYAACHN